MNEPSEKTVGGKERILCFFLHLEATDRPSSLNEILFYFILCQGHVPPTSLSVTLHRRIWNLLQYACSRCKISGPKDQKTHKAHAPMRGKGTLDTASSDRDLAYRTRPTYCSPLCINRHHAVQGERSVKNGISVFQNMDLKRPKGEGENAKCCRQAPSNLYLLREINRNVAIA